MAASSLYGALLRLDARPPADDCNHAAGGGGPAQLQAAGVPREAGRGRTRDPGPAAPGRTAAARGRAAGVYVPPALSLARIFDWASWAVSTGRLDILVHNSTGSCRCRVVLAVALGSKAAARANSVLCRRSATRRRPASWRTWRRQQQLPRKLLQRRLLLQTLRGRLWPGRQQQLQPRRWLTQRQLQLQAAGEEAKAAAAAVPAVDAAA